MSAKSPIAPSLIQCKFLPYLYTLQDFEDVKFAIPHLSGAYQLYYYRHFFFLKTVMKIETIWTNGVGAMRSWRPSPLGFANGHNYGTDWTNIKPFMKRKNCSPNVQTWRHYKVLSSSFSQYSRNFILERYISSQGGNFTSKETIWFELIILRHHHCTYLLFRYRRITLQT